MDQEQGGRYVVDLLTSQGQELSKAIESGVKPSVDAAEQSSVIAKFREFKVADGEIVTKEDVAQYYEDRRLERESSLSPGKIHAIEVLYSWYF